MNIIRVGGEGYLAQAEWELDAKWNLPSIKEETMKFFVWRRGDYWPIESNQFMIDETRYIMAEKLIYYGAITEDNRNKEFGFHATKA